MLRRPGFLYPARMSDSAPVAGSPTRPRLPTASTPPDEVLVRLRERREKDAQWHKGRTFSLVYHAGDAHTELLQQAYRLYFAENALNPMAFPSLRQMENEVVAMTAGLLGGDDAVAGTMTSGGSESLLMAVKTYRDKARAERPQITQPEMILPVTAHPALLKAAHYLGVKPVLIPVGEDFRVDPAADRVVQLGAVHAEMHPAHAETVGLHGCGQDEQGFRLVGGCRLCLCDELVDQWRQRNELVRMGRRQGVGGFGQGVGRRHVAGKGVRHVTAVRLGTAQRVDQGMDWINGSKLRRIAREAKGLLDQAIAQRRRPADIGAAVHVIADPSGEPVGLWHQLGPADGPFGGGHIKHHRRQRSAGLRRPADGRHRLVMFEIERDRRPAAAGRADSARILCRNGVGNGIALRRGEQKGRVSREHSMEQRA